MRRCHSSSRAVPGVEFLRGSAAPGGIHGVLQPGKPRAAESCAHCADNHRLRAVRSRISPWIVHFPGTSAYRRRNSGGRRGASYNAACRAVYSAGWRSRSPADDNPGKGAADLPGGNFRRIRCIHADGAVLPEKIHKSNNRAELNSALYYYARSAFILEWNTTAESAANTTAYAAMISRCTPIPLKSSTEAMRAALTQW